MPLAPELAQEICDRLAAGETLRSICRDPHMPDESYVRKVARQEPDGFGPHYAQARDEGLDCRADELMEVANDPNIPADDKRIRIDARKWYLGKLAPKRYGDRLDLNHGGEVKQVHSISPDAAAVLDRITAALMGSDAS